MKKEQSDVLQKNKRRRKVTPGPWSWFGQTDTHVYKLGNSGHQLICDVGTPPDARLIATAPCLFAVLKQTLPVVEEMLRQTTELNRKKELRILNMEIVRVLALSKK